MNDAAKVAEDLARLERAYYTDLGCLRQLCLNLIEKGQAGQVVILCHELLRFLYPIEPHLGFKHTNPVGFAVKHQRELLSLGKQMLDAIHGYLTERKCLLTQVGTGLETRTSDLYSDLWAQLDREALVFEASNLLKGRLSSEVVEEHVKGKRVLDMGCGSGRYAIALAACGAREVVATDYDSKSYQAAQLYANEAGLAISFCEADVLSMPYPDRSFDFVFSNGVLHHTRNWKVGLAEYARVMKTSGYLYLYAQGGLFWNTRAVLRDIFKRIPRAYTEDVMKLMGVPKNRFFFLDTWYVPIEEHLPRAELLGLMKDLHLSYTPIQSTILFDVDYGLNSGVPGAEIMWGEGEHRYLVDRDGTDI
jgi:ubiquinone/menaquinone biosynthesis C-methylase UbiE